MNASEIIFGFLAGAAVLSALGVVLLRNVVYNALLLGVCFTSIGGIYAVLGADFLFASQILIYVGAIAIIFLFVVLLAGRRTEIVAWPFNHNWGGALLASIVLLSLVAGIYLRIKSVLREAGLAAYAPTTTPIGGQLLGPHALGMEIVGIMLLIALVGVSLLTPGRERERAAGVPSEAQRRAREGEQGKKTAV